MSRRSSAANDRPSCAEVDVARKGHREFPLDGLRRLHLDDAHHRMTRAPAADCEQQGKDQQCGPAVIDRKDRLPPVQPKAERLSKADKPDDEGGHEQHRHVIAVDKPVAADPRQQPRHPQGQVIRKDVRHEIDERQQEEKQEQAMRRDRQRPAQEKPLPQSRELAEPPENPIKGIAMFQYNSPDFMYATER